MTPVVIIPVFNHEHAIGAVVDACHELARHGAARARAQPPRLGTLRRLVPRHRRHHARAALAASARRPLFA